MEVSKVIIELPKNWLETIKNLHWIHTGRSNGKTLESILLNSIRNGLVLPDNPTNEDLINAIFPHMEQDKEQLVHMYGSQSLYDTYEKWLKLPYREVIK